MKYPEKGERVYVNDVARFFVWDGAEWIEERPFDYLVLIAGAVREFGWGIDQALDATPEQVAALLKKNHEQKIRDANLLAIAINAPDKLHELIEESEFMDMDDAEKNRRANRKMQKLLSGRGAKR